MKNYITKKEYGSYNTEVLMELGYESGDEFLTFKQALTIEGISGKSLKGLKTVATLMRVVERPSKVNEDETVKEKKYFRVFYAPDVLARVNQKAAA